jgi:hypothetical protein
MTRFLFLLILMLPSISFGAVLLSEDFDEWPDLKSRQVWPQPWDTGASNGTIVTVTRDSIAHSQFEVASPGRSGSGKAMRAWFHSDAFTGNSYNGALYKNNLGVSHSALYFRWYMKVPTALRLINGGQKMFRFNVQPTGEIYWNFYNEDIRMCPNSGGADCWAAPMAPSADWHDGEWHSHQLYVNLATSTVTYWLDGMQTYHKVGVANMPSTSSTLGGGTNFIQHFPLGNSFSTPYVSSWNAIEYDDLVIATTKIETDPVGIIPCGPTALGYCLTESECETEGGYWYGSPASCNADPYVETPVCGPTRRDLCLTENDCETTGEGYWWGGLCNANEEPTPVTRTLRQAATGTIRQSATGTVTQ